MLHSAGVQGPAPAATRVRIIAAYVALFCTVGIALPYWPAFLESRALSATAIGILLGIGPWVRFSLNPTIGKFADRHGMAHRLVVAGAVILLLSYLGFRLGAETLVSIGALVLVGAVGFGPMVPLLDSIVLRTDGVDYGRTRSWGSAAFIAASFGGGRLLDGQGANAILTALTACAAAVLVAGLFLPGPKREPDHHRTRARDDARAPDLVEADASDRRAARRQVEAEASPWRTSGFAVFLATAALLNGSHAMLYGFGTLHWRAAGVGETTIGVLWGIGVVAEIILFTLGGRLIDRLDSAGLFMVAAGGGMIRWLLLSVNATLPGLLGAQLLHAATFACMHMGAMVFIRNRVDPNATSRATALYSAIATGLAMGTFMPLSGLLFDHYGGHAFVAMAMLSALAFVGALWLRQLLPDHTPART